MGPKKERTAEQKAESARKGAITKARNKATKNATATSRGSSSASSAFLPAASEGTQDPEISENTSQVIKHLEEKFGIKFTTPPGVTNVREWAERYVDDQNTTQSDLVVICDEYAVVTTAAQGLQFQQDLRPNVGAITRELIEVSKLDGFVIGRDVYGLRGYTNYRFSQKNERMPESKSSKPKGPKPRLARRPYPAVTSLLTIVGAIFRHASGYNSFQKSHTC